MATGPWKVLPIISGLAWASSVVKPTCNNVGRRRHFAFTHGVVVLLNLHEDVVFYNLLAAAFAAKLMVRSLYICSVLVAVVGMTAERMP